MHINQEWSVALLPMHVVIPDRSITAVIVTDSKDPVETRILADTCTFNIYGNVTNYVKFLRHILAGKS